MIRQFRKARDSNFNPNHDRDRDPWYRSRSGLIRPKMSGLVINPYSVAPSSIPSPISYIGSVADDTNSATFTFTNASIGSADATRRVVVACHWYSTGVVAQTLSSATIGGSAATIHIQQSPAGSVVSPGCALISRLLATGTTATIVLNISATVARAYIAVYSALNEVASTPSATASDVTLASNALDLSVNTPNGWVLAAATIAGNAAGQSSTWSGVGEDYDTFSAESTSRYYTGGHIGTVTTTPKTITVTNSGTAVDGCGLSMSWA